MNNFWQSRRVLITGANGFLAGWLTQDLIKQGANVYALIYQKNPFSIFETNQLDRFCNIIYSDITSFNAVRKILEDHQISTVFHLGAQAICKTALQSPANTLKSNIFGTINILEAIRQINPKIEIVIASSDKAYGTHENLPYREHYPLHGEFPYEVSKSCADLVSQMYFNTYAIPVCIVRSGNLYGGGDAHFSRVFPNTIRRLYHNQNPIITKNTTRDYLYVEDAALSYRLIAENINNGLAGEAFNTGGENPVKTDHIINLISTAMNKYHIQPIFEDARHKEIPHQYLATDKIRKMVGWQPKVGLEEGVKKTVNWYLNFFQNNQEIAFYD